MLKKSWEQGTRGRPAFESLCPAKPHAQNPLRLKATATARAQDGRWLRLSPHNVQAKTDCRRCGWEDLPVRVESECEPKTAASPSPPPPCCRVPTYPCFLRRGASTQQEMPPELKRASILREELCTTAHSMRRRRAAPCDAEQGRCQSASARSR